jgi:hypothetical protein
VEQEVTEGVSRAAQAQPWGMYLWSRGPRARSNRKWESRPNGMGQRWRKEKELRRGKETGLAEAKTG